MLPGGYVTLFFDVKSDRELPAELAVDMVLPDRWTMLSQRKPERTSGQTNLRYFFVVGTPADMPAGKFSFDLQLSAQHAPLASTSVTIEVDQVRKVEVLVFSKPEFVKEGAHLRVEYLIQNSGNVAEILSLKTSRGVVESAGDSLTIAANSQKKIVVDQLIPVTENNAWQSSSDLLVERRDVPGVISQFVSVPVFSSTVKKIDPFFRLPIEVGGAYFSYRYADRKMMAYQYSLSGKGYLDQKSRHYLDFTFRGPNQFSFPALGSYDQYSVDYQYRKKTFISAGDYILQLNNLMEIARFGRGAMIEQRFDKVYYGLFYQKARFYFNQKQSLGGKIGFNIGGASNLTLSYISKNVNFHDRQFWSNLLGVSGQVSMKGLYVESELAAGKANKKTDYGAFLRFRLARDLFTVSGNVIYAGKDFYGYYNNSLQLNGNIGFNITKQLSVGLNGNFSNVNPSLDATLYSASPKDRSGMIYMAFQPTVKHRFFVFYSMQDRVDRQQPPKFNYAENFVNLSYNYNTDRFAFFYQGRYGKAQNRLFADTIGGTKESFSNLVQPNFRIFSRLWAGVNLEHQHTSKFSNENQIQDLFFYGGNLKLTVNNNLYATFMYRNNYAPDELYQRRSFMDASVVMELGRHRFSASGGRSYIPNSANANQNTIFFVVRYAMKINLAISRKRNIGTVRGRLTGEGFSKAGNLIQLGNHKFLTDSSGYFAFQGLPPDQYYLSLSQNDSKNTGVIPVGKMPMFIDVKADSTKVVEIPLTRTGAVSGKVEFGKPVKVGVSAALEYPTTVLLKLQKGTESFLTEMNEKGEFTFKEMKPGQWILSAIIPGNQDRFMIEDNERPLVLESDRTKDVTFRIKPNEKRIHFSGKSFDLSIKK